MQTPDRTALRSDTITFVVPIIDVGVNGGGELYRVGGLIAGRRCRSSAIMSA